jgi:hypothetical protein
MDLAFKQSAGIDLRPLNAADLAHFSHTNETNPVLVVDNLEVFVRPSDTPVYRNNAEDSFRLGSFMRVSVMENPRGSPRSLRTASLRMAKEEFMPPSV